MTECHVSVLKNNLPPGVWFNRVNTEGLVFHVTLDDSDSFYAMVDSPYNRSLFNHLGEKLKNAGYFNERDFGSGGKYETYETYCIRHLRIPKHRAEQVPMRNKNLRGFLDDQ